MRVVPSSPWRAGEAGEVGRESRQRIVAALAGVGDDELEARLCQICAELLAVSGVGVAVVTDGGHRQALHSSDSTATALEDPQDSLGQGPSIDAHRLGFPVVEADLAKQRAPQWPAFTGPALAAGAAAVFAFPMRTGGFRLGVLTLYQGRPGPLAGHQHTDALATADVVMHAILALQAGAPPGLVAASLQAVGSDRVEVHQASGMVAACLEVSVADALVRLRACAFAEDRRLVEIARDVVARRLHLT